MNKEEILHTIGILAMSQGSYGRLLDELLCMDEEEFYEWMTETFDHEPADSVDMVMMLEGY